MAQFIESPVEPVQPDTQWLVWKRDIPLNTTMTTFGAKAAYLVKVADAAPDFTLQLTGRPQPPGYAWSSEGLNFFGFPMETPDDVDDRNFERFLSFSSELGAGPDIFSYEGGPLSSNPVRVIAPRFKEVSRGRAYWIQSSQFTDYYGPLRVTIRNSGLSFGDTGTALTMEIQNVTDSALDATLALAASAPAGHDVVAGPVPLRICSALNPETGQFDFADFVAPTDYALEAGQLIEVVFAVDRAAMGGNPGDVFQSLLQVTDSENISRIDLPASAVTTSRSGLWVGAAVVTAVDQITAAPDPLPDGTGTVVVSTDADADAPSAFPIRLILHRADSGTVKLLQQVYIGVNTSGDTIIATAESALDPVKLANARRLSSATFPLDEKVINSGADLGLAGTASFSSVLSHTAATNPFLHTYHPDHDNKDAQFSPVALPEGDESYTVSRAIDLNFVADPSTIGLSDLGWGSTVLGGDYEETITGLRAQPITVKGTFVLRRVSSIDTLTE